MGSNDEFGPDTETIRAWLAKRATYAKDARVIAAPRGTLATDVPRDPGPSRPEAPSATEEQEEPQAHGPEAPGTADEEPTRHDPAAARPDSRNAGRSVLDALEGTAPAARPAPRTSADATAAGRSVVEALGADEPAARKERGGRAKPKTSPAPAAPEPPRTTVIRPSSTVRVSAPAARASYQASTRSAPAPAPAPRQEQTVRRGRWTEPEEHRKALEASTDVDFPVRGGIRRFLGFVLLGAVLATGGAAYVANKDRTVAMIGLAGVLAFLTLVVWAVRASCVTTELSIHRGQLTVRRAGHAQHVDISGGHTVIAIVGEPGDRRWTVLFERPGLPLIVINASMVDPHWFTSSLYRLRPELRPGWSDPEVSGDFAGVR